ncbi:MAG: hypothetical protein GEU78_06850 [Actinobacteria bacterium]|nr:hypothetical protein [Actinomycetota bacterium]
MSEQRPSEEQVEERARELEHGGEGVEDIEGDAAKAERAAERILEDSEGRTFDPATVDPEDDSVIRRNSEETAAKGDDA